MSTINHTCNGFAIERDDGGAPIRLIWSSEFKSVQERKLMEDAFQAAERARRNALPMAAMIEWAKARGLA